MFLWHGAVGGITGWVVPPVEGYPPWLTGAAWSGTAEKLISSRTSSTRSAALKTTA